MNNPVISLVNLLFFTTLLSCRTTPELGIFEGNTDIGNVQHAGSAEFDPSMNAYTVTGGGTNMWFNNEGLFFVGFGVCAHNNDTVETAVFSDVVIEPIARTPDSLKQIESSLEIISVTSLNRRVVYHTKSHIEAPNWSPDGKWLCFISYGTDVPAHAHPANKDVMLRLMDLETGEIRVVANIFGGQGTINVPSWSPDGERFAFVSYQMR